MSWDDLNDENYDWPKVEEVRQYRNQVRTLVCDLIDTMSFSMPIDWESPMWPVVMGIEHERIHLETSSVLIRQLPIASVRPSPEWPACSTMQTNAEALEANVLMTVPAQKVINDKAWDSAYYGWDNEYGSQQESVSEFSASKFLVSNGEYLSFV